MNQPPAPVPPPYIPRRDEPTQPPPAHDPLAHFQPVYVYRQSGPPAPAPLKRRRRGLPGGCGCLVVLLLFVLAAGAGYLLAPGGATVLLMGIDRAADGGNLSRSDTILVMRFNTLPAGVKMLSIPRDLWVPIPGVGENRINTAHFFAEASQPGSGPQALQDTIRADFGLQTDYYARVRFDGFKDIVDAMGGVTLTLDEPMGGLEAGVHHLDGAQALAFARDRKGTDDFFRMNQGQTVLIAAARQFLNPLTWPRIPIVLGVFSQVVDTNLPLWQWPRLGFAMVRAGTEGIDHRTLTREMVTPYLTDQGAQVLLPNWDAILPVVQEMFP